MIMNIAHCENCGHEFLSNSTALSQDLCPKCKSQGTLYWATVSKKVLKME